MSAIRPTRQRPRPSWCINQEDGITVISNLHLQTAKDYCDRIIGLRQGVIVFDGLPSEFSDSLAREIYSSEENGDEEVELAFNAKSAPIKLTS
jgi:ABC-type phosphate/phosphonate transport system ATPase subunit